MITYICCGCISTTAENKYSDASKEGISSLAEHTIEYDLVQYFSWLDLSVMIYVDARPPSRHLKIKDEGVLTVQRMLAIFSSTSEARLYWDLVHHRIGSRLQHHSWPTSILVLSTQVVAHYDGLL
jgi:hypothetical protein